MKWLFIGIAALVGFFLLKVCLGFFMLKSSGRALLKKNLREYGLNIDSFPDAFFNDTIDNCWETAEAMHKIEDLESKYTYYVALIKKEAYRIKLCIEGKNTGIEYDGDTSLRLEKYRLF